MPLDFFRIPELTAKEDKLYQTVCGCRSCSPFMMPALQRLTSVLDNNITDTMKFMSNPRSRLVNTYFV